MRPLSATIAIACSALAVAACGSESIAVSDGDETASAGAEIFAANCAGCHTLSAAGSQGSGNRALRAQGPNFDQRVETYDEVLLAIRNGGFSGAIMPQNIVVGEDAELVAQFVADYSGSDVEEPPRPSDSSTAAEPATEESTSTTSATEQGTTEQEAGGAPPAEGSQAGGGGGSGSG